LLDAKNSKFEIQKNIFNRISIKLQKFAQVTTVFRSKSSLLSQNGRRKHLQQIMQNHY